MELGKPFRCSYQCCHTWVVCVCLLQGKYFYLTPGVCPSLSTMKSILESAGGKLLAKQPSYRKIIEHKQNKVKPFTPVEMCSISICIGLLANFSF